MTAEEQNEILLENRRMRKALEFIRDWQLPLVDDGHGGVATYECMKGSNGVRKYCQGGIMITQTHIIPTGGQFVMVWEYEGEVWSYVCKVSDKGRLLMLEYDIKGHEDWTEFTLSDSCTNYTFLQLNKKENGHGE